MTYDKSMLMKRAHREWRIVRDRPGLSFGMALQLVWRVERRRVQGREFYQPPPADDWVFVDPSPSILVDTMDTLWGDLK